MKKISLLFLILIISSCTMVEPQGTETPGSESPSLWPDYMVEESGDGTLVSNYELKYLVPDKTILIEAVDSEADVSFSVGEPGHSENWTISHQAEISFPETGTYEVKARAWKEGDAAGEIYLWIYNVSDSFPGFNETAVSLDNSHIKGWATGVEYNNTDAGSNTNPDAALGKPSTDSTDAVSIGNGGSIVLTFAHPVSDQTGWDFAVFENGLIFSSDAVFQEWAFVEVSSNGTDFLAFDCAGTVPSPIGSYDALPPGVVYGLAGNLPVGYGTPFDLNDLRNKGEVIDGTVNLDSITHIRLRDINYPADTTAADSFGDPLYDPPMDENYPDGPNGFDLSGVAVFNWQE